MLWIEGLVAGPAARGVLRQGKALLAGPRYCVVVRTGDWVDGLRGEQGSDV